MSLMFHLITYSSCDAAEIYDLYYGKQLGDNLDILMSLLGNSYVINLYIQSVVKIIRFWYILTKGTRNFGSWELSSGNYMFQLALVVCMSMWA